ncbi:MAG: helix-turn-helix transcriptional regulator [Chloroflexi bacterium]|nr:helix-turn-helix transcriptional regulator [Chloroflexota bacterium]
MKLETRVFDLYHGRYSNLTDMARAMGISVSQVYRVRQGKRTISEKFVTGTKRAFPEYRLDDLSHVVPSGKQYDKK